MPTTWRRRRSRSGPADAGARPDGWYIGTESVLVEKPSSRHGDSPVMGIIGFRTRLGVYGAVTKTRVWVHRPFTVLCRGARAGTTCTIPDGAGAVHFGPVNRPPLDDLAVGGPMTDNTPEIVGTITYVSFLHGAEVFDLAPVAQSLHGRVMAAAAGSNDISNPTSAGEVANGALEVFQNIERFGSEGGFLPGTITGMVGVGDDLRDEVDPALVRGRRDRGLSRTAAAVLGSRSLTLAHDFGGGIRYVTSERVYLRPPPNGG